jgi:hypothetical protein
LQECLTPDQIRLIVRYETCGVGTDLHLRVAQGGGVQQRDGGGDARAQHQGAQVAQALRQLGRQADQVVLQPENLLDVSMAQALPVMQQGLWMGSTQQERTKALSGCRWSCHAMSIDDQ